ncbi:30S ribosomal protein S13 [Candidatus Dojkabacteria bacterium CG_4_9_14_3_um_filter_150_Dojkabacteria_WS6_41_13]|uniref:Small ribosomal subunit protein uS13 n=1 Tax=Candidatus Dojkabacteria bacterium CG_4_10_14_0_2_um_filter_Dojkabacteria_WS6_41_15 TaxID=2014249 RepID=A0A2M7W0W3_9BACT|nr:MAG: 30S ribosomal protein S13 [Candidatus Dojkabacteria bacterium CG_4_10_14_3_um_filter_Dojkabacteria_WS6_41_9]PJA12544.1 MAG: 30S ribosomal protein S13 [Candidatus Dojkabacteria bacterium CG_4_10_14_0_2_um_filter_Dojkabacteria_WS6_41_15]PJB22978.1 MAG: 30S ribosomal protein S13 [Candidatus Dojkabacteria bacterium CG_4_9_14_3_um_filter_150_Dojkabacteria_WS6_41_13]
MPRILGIQIPDDKKVRISLRYLFGIGPARAEKICKTCKIDPDKRAHELKDPEIKAIQNFVDENFVVEGYLRQEVREHIRRLKDIKSYRGVRHIINMPVRGQRTRHNAHTRRGKNMAVGGLNPKVTKT